MLDCRDYTEKREKLGVNSGEGGGRVGREGTCVGEETFTAERVTAVCEVPGTGFRVLWNVYLCDIDCLIVR